MQIFQANLSEVVDPDSFLQAWEIDAKLNRSPRVDFDFQSNHGVVMRVHSTPTNPWDEASFKKTVALALHRVGVAPQCEIKWLEPGARP
ncbi:MAG: hypothetical protein ABSF71_10345 [Terriglobia bacterium]|jgi:hypothetical protein